LLEGLFAALKRRSSTSASRGPEGPLFDMGYFHLDDFRLNDNPTFRLAGESDAETVLEFMRAYYAFDGHTFDCERARGVLTGLLRDEALGRCWLILEGDCPIGYIVLCFGYSLEWLGRDAFIDEFYLREEYRGRGWGRRTMEFVEEAARKAGVRVLHMEVMRGNSGAFEAYRKLGFRERQSSLLSKGIGDCSERRGGGGQ
jgi:ribosomal protein S18 acetylase RimI-like enzyme